MNRRHFLSAASAAAAAMPVLSAKPFSKPLGIQLYTARSTWPADPEGVLKRVADIGYKEVELYAADQIEKLGPTLKKLGLAATSIHIADAISLADDDTKFKQTLDQAVAAGIKYGGVPYVAPNARGPKSGPELGEFWKKWSAKMNRAAATANKAGVTFFYHHHAFEFAGTVGERPIDFMKKELDPKLVKLEMDIFWVAAAGADPIAVMKEWKGRVALMHLKDRASSMATIATESQAKPGDFKEVGNGSLDFKAILNTALSTGVAKFYVEQDQCPGDPVDSLKISFDNLKKVSL
ncbi:MAG: sugar phosphate isomerase/epimerase [Acidobacteria bacterium]|nr:sugar phosphate isomerase/epimerase [Acidobacteriota bacterium]